MKTQKYTTSDGIKTNNIDNANVKYYMTLDFNGNFVADEDDIDSDGWLDNGDDTEESFYISGFANAKETQERLQAYCESKGYTCHIILHEVEVMTKKQAELIDELESLRKKIDYNMDGIAYHGGSYPYDQLRRLVLLNVEIKKSGLAPMEFVPSEEDDYIDIDTIDELMEVEQIPEDETKRLEWYDTNESRIKDELYDLLANIDTYVDNTKGQFGASKTI